MLFSCRFYKRLEDLDSLKEYNDYLEEFEDLVFNLVHDVDVQSTYNRLVSFKSENRDSLEKNLARLANEQRQVQLAEEQEKSRKEAIKNIQLREIEQERDELSQVKKKFIDELVIGQSIFAFDLHYIRLLRMLLLP
jgi:CDK-activating kinase assembly factor MAT1